VVTAEVTPGICGLVARIECRADEAYNASITLESACPRAQEFGGLVQQIAVLDEIGRTFADSRVYSAASAAGLHLACPLPMAILKAIEVATGLGLPADVHLTLRRE